MMGLSQSDTKKHAKESNNLDEQIKNSGKILFYSLMLMSIVVIKTSISR